VRPRRAKVDTVAETSKHGGMTVLQFKRAALPVLACLTLLGACSKTTSVATTGLVLDLSGRPVAGAEVRAEGLHESEIVRSGPNGRFTVEAARERSAIPLPGSGVYLDPVYLVATTPSEIAYGAAMALSVSEETAGDAILILMSSNAVEASCVPETEAGAYALALSDRLDPADAWITELRESGLTESLHDRLRGDLSRLSQACGIENSVMVFARERLETALSAYAD